MAFARFMASPAGRGIRILAGVVLIVVGYGMHSGLGTVLAVAGLVPVAAGVLNLCLFGPLFHAPFAGKDVEVASRKDGGR